MSVRELLLGKDDAPVRTAAEMYKISKAEADKKRASDDAKMRGRLARYRRKLLECMEKSAKEGYISAAYAVDGHEVHVKLQLFDVERAFRVHVLRPLKAELKPLGYKLRLRMRNDSPVLRIRWPNE